MSACLRRRHRRLQLESKPCILPLVIPERFPMSAVGIQLYFMQSLSTIFVGVFGILLSPCKAAQCLMQWLLPLVAHYRSVSQARVILNFLDELDVVLSFRRSRWLLIRVFLPLLATPFSQVQALHSAVSGAFLGDLRVDCANDFGVGRRNTRSWVVL